MRSAEPARARSSAPGELGVLLSGDNGASGVWTVVGSCGNSNLDNSVWNQTGIKLLVKGLIIDSAKN